MNKIILMVLLIGTAVTGLDAQANGGLPYVDTLPPAVSALADSLFTGKDSTTVKSLYDKAVAFTEKNLKGIEQTIARAQCSYFMGASCLGQDKDAAAKYFQAGYDAAKKALTAKTDNKTLARVEAVFSQNAGGLYEATGSLGRGIDSASYAQKALKLDPDNSAARYMNIGRYVSAPAAFRDINTGMKELAKALGSSALLEKSDYFQACIAYAYCYMTKKDSANEKVWLAKAAAVYPQSGEITRIRNGKEPF
jgi:tetratricopeptide (TPR) repeat protein